MKDEFDEDKLKDLIDEDGYVRVDAKAFFQLVAGAKAAQSSIAEMANDARTPNEYYSHAQFSLATLSDALFSLADIAKEIG